MKKIHHIILLFISITFLSKASLANGKWYANTSLQMVGSDFQDGTGHNSFFFYGGVRYQANGYFLSLNIPFVLRNGNTFTQLGNSYFPNNGNNNSSDHMGRSSGTRSINVGLGDSYLNGSFRVIKETKVIPNFSIEGYIKFPTASPVLGIGTGEFDYQLALGIRKFIDNFSLFGQFGYLFLGDTEGAETINPLTISLGVGYAFGYGEHSILLAYDSYTTIVQGISSPRQLALGYNYMIRKGLFFTTIISAGLNTSTSDYTVSGGLNFEL